MNAFNVPRYKVGQKLIVGTPVFATWSAANKKPLVLHASSYVYTVTDVYERNGDWEMYLDACGPDYRFTTTDPAFIPHSGIVVPTIDQMYDHIREIGSDGTSAPGAAEQEAARARIVKQLSNPLQSAEVEQVLRKEMRMSPSGATRDTSARKLDFEGFTHPLITRRFAEYMNEHRTTPDGPRQSDNWQKGMPRAWYIKSMIRHVEDLRLHFDGHAERATDAHIDNILCAIMFNVQGYLLEVTLNRDLPDPEAT